MKKIDRYILGKYMTSFFFCLLLFTVIVVVVDISEKTDDFVKANLTAWQITRDYYFGFVPRIDAMLFPLFVFISVIFFTSKMAGRSEVIAILSAGVSFRRYMMPFLAGGIFLGALLWLSYQYVVPRANRKWADFEKRYVDVNKGSHDENEGTSKKDLYFKVDSNSYAGIASYDTIRKTGTNFFLNRYHGNELIYNLRARSFSWDTIAHKWKLQGVLERTLHPISETVRKNDTLVMSYSFKPIDLRKDDYLKDQMTTSELNEFIRMEKMRGSETLSSLLVEKYNRDAIPVSVIILTIIGATLASRKVRGGSGAHLAIGVLISVTYILFSRFSVVFATKGSFSPFLAAWLPNIIFGLLAIYLYRKAPK